jgi:ribosomal protein L37AE/L43A
MSNHEGSERIRWAPKVHPNKIRRLYEAEASGLLSEEVVNEVGIELLLRVEAILNAMHGRLQCPRCRKVFTVEKKEEEILCPQPRCGWQSTHAAYKASKRHRDLNVANALPAFEAFARNYPQARAATERMRLIDRLIHEFHWDAKQKLPNRSVGNNLIEGSHSLVVAFLDELSSSGGVDRVSWRQTVAQMWSRRRGEVG